MFLPSLHSTLLPQSSFLDDHQFSFSILAFSRTNFPTSFQLYALSQSAMKWKNSDSPIACSNRHFKSTSVLISKKWSQQHTSHAHAYTCFIEWTTLPATGDFKNPHQFALWKAGSLTLRKDCINPVSCRNFCRLQKHCRNILKEDPPSQRLFQVHDNHL